MINFDKLLPSIRGNLNLIRNSSWLVFEQVIRLANGLLLGVFIARSYSPEAFGTYSLLVALFSLLLPVSRFGLDQVCVREFTGLAGRDAGRVASSSFFISLLSASCLILIVLLGLHLSKFDIEGFGLVLILLLLSLYSSCFNFVDFWFQSKTNSAPVARVKILCSVLSLLIKLAMVHYAVDLKYIISMVAVEALLVSICYIFLYGFKYRYFGFKLSLDISYIPKMSRSGFYILISSMFVIVNTRIDQFFISYYLGNHELGLYAAVVKINEAVAVIPFILSVSLLPMLTKLYSSDGSRFNSVIRLMYQFFSFYSLVLFAIVYLLGENLITFIYDEKYSASASAFLILSGTCFFNCISIVNARYLMIKGQEHLITVRVFGCSVLNVVFNYFLIPVYGIEGAAVSTLISSVMMALCFDSVYSDLFRIRYYSFLKRSL